MRLTRTPLELTLRQAWTIARNSSIRKTNVLLRLEEGGLEGLGEAAPNVRYGEDWRSVVAAIDAAAPLLEEGATRYGEIIDRLAAAAPAAPSARAAIDMALHDLAGRREGVPVWRLLGADPARMPPTSFSIGIDTPGVMQAKARAAAGFAVLKVKAGSDDDRARLEAVRAATDRPLIVDANEGWHDREEALRTIRWMAGLGVTLVEQPLPAADLDGARWLAARSPLPILADEAVVDESDLEALPGAYHGVNLKVQKVGGLRAARRMIGRARSLGLRVMLGCMIESSLGITASAHLAPLCDDADLDGHLLLEADPFAGVGLEASRLVLSDAAGLGVTPR